MSGEPEGTPAPETWEPVAVVGLACRLPGAGSPDEFWRLLSEGREAVGPPPERLGETVTERGPGWGGYLDDVSGFDAGFFGISPREAEAMDPQQRLMLELGWEAVERARIAPSTLRGARVGVFTGAIGSDHALLLDREGPEALTRHSLTGTHRSLIANRVSHALGLRGPSMTVDAGQASSLVSVQMAVESLRRGESEMALAGGVSLILVPESTEAVARFGGLSPDARCHTFDARANGYVRGEGGAVVVLKPLGRAQTEGDRVLAVIHGGAVNHSGEGEFLTRPTVRGQAEAIRAAHENAGVRPDRVGYVELHGTGTPAGDPVEARALGEVFGAERSDPLRVGSAKTNVGHLEGAAGIVGLVKTVLSLDHQTLPPSLNFVDPHPEIDLDGLGLSVQSRREPWPGHSPLAGVSAFAMGGTNCHLVVGPAPGTDQSTAEHGGGFGGSRVLDPVPWVLSARSEAALRDQASALHAHVSSRQQARALDVGLSLATTRDVFEHRAVVFASGENDTRELESVRLTEGGGGPVPDEHGPVLVFPGQGGQWVGMGRELLTGEGLLAKAFSQRIRVCERALRPHVDWSLAAVLRGDAQAPPLTGEGARVDVVQPVLWAVMVSLAHVWSVLGLRPSAVVGHSQGELAAACVAEALPLEEAARIVALRSRALTALAGSGAMASLGVSPEEAADLAASLPDLHVAAVNGPRAVVVSGTRRSVHEAVRWCVDRGLHGSLVDVDYASHSSHVERLRGRLLTALGRVRWRPATIPFYSTLTGTEPGDGGPALDADYWYEGLRNPVRFASAVRALVASGRRTFIEVGPHPVLSYGLRRTLAEEEVRGHVLETLRRGEGDQARLLTAAAEAFTAGVDIDWSVLFDGTGARATDLPTYRFQRERFTRARPRARAVTSSEPLDERGLELVDGRTVFGGRLDDARQSWVLDHRMLGRTVLPGAAVAGLVSHAGERSGAATIAQLTIEEPLVLPGGARETELQVTLGPADARGVRDASVHSRGPGEPAWTRHASGSVEPGGLTDEPRSDTWPPPEAVEIGLDPEEAYRRLSRRGYAFGRLFRGLRQVWRLGDTLLARVELPRRHGLSPAGVHPALVDSALHAALLFEARGEDTTLVSASWRGLRTRAGAAPTELRVALEPLGADRYRVTALDQSGLPVLEVDEVALRPVEQGTLPTAPGEEPVLYQLRWDPTPVPRGTADAPANLPALDDLAPDGPVPDVVFAELPAAVVYTEGESVPGSVREGLSAALVSVRSWLRAERFAGATLALVTWRSVSVGPDEYIGGLAAAPVWGLLRSVQREHPGRLVLVDTDGSERSHGILASAVRSGEPQMALRNGGVLVPRLVPAVDADRPVPSSPVWRLDTRVPGSPRDLDLTTATDATAPLRPGQVRVALRAAGVSRRDATTSPGEDGARRGMGLDGAGVVLETAEDVTDLSVGDRVTGLFPGALGPIAVADRRVLARIPDTWGFAEAAAVPGAYLVAYHALVDVAGLRPGESVLVHSAASGVGLAAVQLARHMGARVFGTASPHKWAALEEHGLSRDRLAPSRALDFEDALREANGGQGMDVILNSLTGRFVDASLRLLRSPADGRGAGGRFVELGGTDVRSEAEVAAAHPGRGYETFELLALSPERVGQMLTRVMELLAAGTVRLLPVREFDVRDAEEAFAALRRGEHVGRTVLNLPAHFPQGTTVLVTGGTGELGHRVARHLVAGYGVRHLTLLSRHGAAAPGQDERTDELRGLGAEVVVHACDAADRSSLERLVRGLDRPLGAVVHAAGVIDGAPVLDGDPDRLEEMLRAKVDAVWNLHEVTEEMPLASFVLFSCAGGVVGSPGHAHQAAADVFCEALAHLRRGRGLPATSLAWGSWRGDDRPTEEGDTATAGGVLWPMASDRALAKLDAALYLRGTAYVPALLDTDTPDLPVLSALAAARTGVRPERPAVTAARPTTTAVGRSAEARTGEDTGTGAVPTGGDLTGIDGAERERRLLAVVRAHTADVLGRGDGSGVPADRPFRELGLDSMGGVELRNRLSETTGRRLPTTAVFDYPNPRAMALFLTKLMESDNKAAQAVEGTGEGTKESTGGESGASDIDQMDVAGLLGLALGAQGRDRLGQGGDG